MIPFTVKTGCISTPSKNKFFYKSYKKGEKMKTKIIITGGKVHEVGYRPFLLDIAESLELKRFFANNTFEDGKEVVYVLLDCSEEKIKTFKEIVRTKLPENAAVNQILEEEYKGTVMKTENYYRYLTAMQLSKIVTYGGKMLEKQDETIAVIKGESRKMLQKQDAMLEKQDETIAVIKEESHKTRETVREESYKTRDELKTVIQDESQKTRKTIVGESRMTRDTLVEHLKNDIAEIRAEIAEIKEKIAG